MDWEGTGVGAMRKEKDGPEALYPRGGKEKKRGGSLCLCWKTLSRRAFGEVKHFRQKRALWRRGTKVRLKKKCATSSDPAEENQEESDRQLFGRNWETKSPQSVESPIARKGKGVVLLSRERKRDVG